MINTLSIVCLSIVAILCTWGVFTRFYNESLLERLGMSLIAIWCISRIVHKVEFGYTEAQHLFLHVGMASLAVGMVWAKFLHRDIIRLRNKTREYNREHDAWGVTKHPQ